MAPPIPAPAMSGSANFAVFVITVLWPAFSFPTADAPLTYTSIFINVAVVLAGMVILSEVISFLLKLGAVSSMIDALKSFVICTSMCFLFAAFVLYSLITFIGIEQKFSLTAISVILNNIILAVPFFGFGFLLSSGSSFVITTVWKDLKDDDSWKEQTAKLKLTGRKLADLLKLTWRKLADLVHIMWKKVCEAFPWIAVVCLLLLHVFIFLAIAKYVKRSLI